MIMHTWKTKANKHSADGVEFKADLPTTIDEVKLIEKRYGTVERMIDRANAQWTVDVATGVRKRLPSEERAQAYVETYCDNGSKDTYTRPAIDANEAKKEQGFTDEQLKWIEERGMIVS